MSIEEKLANLLGGRGRIGATDSAPWRRDWLDTFGEIFLGIARPASTVEVSEVIKLYASAGVPVVSQGENTYLAGGAVLAHVGGIILSLPSMNALGVTDNIRKTVTVETGTVLAHLHQQLDGSGFMFPMHIGAEGSAQIGGMIVTNAGGSHAFSYGVMQDLVLSLEAVLPDGPCGAACDAFRKTMPATNSESYFVGPKECSELSCGPFLKLMPNRAERVLRSGKTFAFRLGQLANEMGGSFAAGHGVGRIKAALADQLRHPLERALMGCLKAAFDRDGILNPGAIVADRN